MLGLSATRQQASTTVDCAQKHSSCTICCDKLHCNDKIVPPAGSLPQLFWACRWRYTLRYSHASAATCSKICGQPARFSRQLEALYLDLRRRHSPHRLSQRGSADGDLTATWAHPKGGYHLTCCWRLQSSEDPNAMPSALPTFAIASIPGSSSIRKPRISRSRQLIWKIKT